MTTIPRARPGSVQPAHDVRHHQFHVAEARTTFDDVMSAEYWQQNALALRNRPWALIEVVSASGQWEALLRVVSYADDGIGGEPRAQVTVRCLMKWQAVQEMTEVPSGYEVLSAGAGWTVLAADRHRFREPVATQVQTEAEARQIAVEHAARYTEELAEHRRLRGTAPM